MDIEKVKEKVQQITQRLGKKDILAVGLFGSLARGDFNDRSDIDIFIITEKELTIREQDDLYCVFSQLIPEFGRDITVLVYDINSLRKVPCWQTLNLIKDANLIYDVGEIEHTFHIILKEAEEHGIIYDAEEKVFKLERTGRIVFSSSLAGTEG